MFNYKGEEYIGAEVGDFSFCCGLTEVGRFSAVETDDDDGLYPGFEGVLVPRFENQVNIGTGLFVATFINTPICKEAYTWFCEHYQLVTQTPLKRNKTTGNRVFLAVFDSTVKAKK